MSELVVYKANELAVSRYDLTEHDTKLILYCVSRLNPTIENPTREQRTVKFTCAEYAKAMELSQRNAWGRLNAATSDLFRRSIELIYPTGAVSKRIFNWAGYAEFNRDDQTVELIFSEEIQPLLFQLKKFIKYNLKHVKAFENKYSMRVYEWLLKELTQRKTHKANIEISLKEFKFMLMLDKHQSYVQFKELNRWVLKTISEDLNTYSNMKLAIEKKGRPVDTLIFQCELDKQMDLVTELSKEITSKPPQKSRKRVKLTQDELLRAGVIKTLHEASEARIQLAKFEAKFLDDLNKKYELNSSFSWLTEKQRGKLEAILAKYGNV